MPKTLVIDPVTRIEGHLEIEVTVDNARDFGIDFPELETKHGDVAVDAGHSSWCARRIVEALREVGLTPGDLKLCVLTHRHWDHSGGARALKDFAREISKGQKATFTILGGILGDSILDANGAISLADLPSREVQLAMLVGAIAAPMTTLVSLVSAPHRDLISLLQARIDKEGGEEAAEAA